MDQLLGILILVSPVIVPDCGIIIFGLIIAVIVAAVQRVYFSDA